MSAYYTDTALKPGCITRPCSFAISMYATCPNDNVIYKIPERRIDVLTDGLLLIVATVRTWHLVLTSRTCMLGWVFEYDLGVSSVPASVYATPTT